MSKDIYVKRDRKLCINVRSIDDYNIVDDFDYELDNNILIVNTEMTATFNNIDLELRFKITTNIDLDKITNDREGYHGFSIDKWEFIGSNVNPKNIEDIDKIISYSYETSVLGIEDYELPYYIKKDPSILDNMILLIDKANEDHIEYDKNDINSVVYAFNDIVTGDIYITKYLYQAMKEVDPIIADKVMTSLQKIVQDMWDPYLGDGLDDSIQKRLIIDVQFE